MSEKTYKYKNISSQDQQLMGVGFVPAGETVETSAIIHNGNFALVDSPKEEAKPKPPKK